jgi:hypothetical protein
MRLESPDFVKKLARVELTTESERSPGDDTPDESMPLRSNVKHWKVHQYCLALAEQPERRQVGVCVDLAVWCDDTFRPTRGARRIHDGRDVGDTDFLIDKCGTAFGKHTEAEQGKLAQPGIRLAKSFVSRWAPYQYDFQFRQAISDFDQPVEKALFSYENTGIGIFDHVPKHLSTKRGVDWDFNGTQLRETPPRWYPRCAIVEHQQAVITAPHPDLSVGVGSPIRELSGRAV